jgi:uncharacterized membrane protein
VSKGLRVFLLVAIGAVALLIEFANDFRGLSTTALALATIVVMGLAAVVLWVRGHLRGLRLRFQARHLPYHERRLLRRLMEARARGVLDWDEVERRWQGRDDEGLA